MDQVYDYDWNKSRSQKTLKGYDNVVRQEGSILGHALFKCGYLGHQISQVCGALALWWAWSDQFGIQSFSLVLLQFFDKCVLHFCQETSVKLVPLSSLQIALLQNSGLTEYIDLATNIHVPTVNNLAMILFLAWIDFLYIVLGVLNDDFMRLAVEFIDYGDLVSLPIFYPPGLESEALDIVFKTNNWWNKTVIIYLLFFISESLRAETR